VVGFYCTFVHEYTQYNNDIDNDGNNDIHYYMHLVCV